MKKVIFALLVLLLLASCFPNPSVTGNVVVDVENSVSNSNSSNISAKAEPVLIQCFDGSFVDDVSACPKSEIRKETAGRTIAQDLLEQANEKFSSYAFVVKDAVVINHGNKSRYMFDKLSKIDEVPVTDVFVDKEKKTAVAYCNIDREARLSQTSFDYERSKCRHYLDVPINVSFEKWVPAGPLEFLERFENETPVLFENSTLTMSIGGNSKTIQPSLHYVVNGARVILRIDKRYLVPARIEFENASPVDFRDTDFDLMVVDGKQQRITKEWVVYQNVSEYWLKGNTK